MTLAALAAALVVSLSAPGHTPAANAKWFYTVKATVAGKPVRAKLTVQIVDPFGGVHPVTYASTKRPLVNWPFKGRFRDYVQFPAESAGLKVTVRITVKAGAKRRVLS